MQWSRGRWGTETVFILLISFVVASTAMIISTTSVVNVRHYVRRYRRLPARDRTLDLHYRGGSVTLQCTSGKGMVFYGEERLPVGASH